MFRRAFFLQRQPLERFQHIHESGARFLFRGFDPGQDRIENEALTIGFDLLDKADIFHGLSLIHI